MKKNILCIIALSAAMWHAPAIAMDETPLATGLSTAQWLSLYGAVGLGADYLARKEKSLEGKIPGYLTSFVGRCDQKISLYKKTYGC